MNCHSSRNHRIFINRANESVNNSFTQKEKFQNINSINMQLCYI